MGNQSLTMAVQRATFEDVRANVSGKTGLVISVLAETDQQVLISGTVPCVDEVAEVEKAIHEKKEIIVYGTNNHDERVLTKYNQLKKLGGLPKVYVGGLFEWILLQEFYGKERFALTTYDFDLYQYRPK